MLIEVILKELNLEIIDVEWVNEFGTNILRIIADSKESLNIDQATALNEAMKNGGKDNTTIVLCKVC